MKRTSLTSLHVFKLKKYEFVAFITDFIEIFDQSGLPADFDGVFELLYRRLRSQLSTYQGLIEPLSVEDLTGLQLEAESQVNAAYEALALGLKAHQLSQEREIREAYRDLTVLLRPYEGQAMAMKDLIKRLAEPAYKLALETLRLTTPKEALVAASENLVSLTENPQAKPKRSKGNTKETRDELTRTYYQLADYVALMWDITGINSYEFCLGIINDIRKFYANILAEGEGKPKEI